MALPMTRPFKHPKTGIYWIRKRVPADIYPLVGVKEISRSLKTKDAAEAKARLVEALADIEKRWINLRAGKRTLTEREAHEMARQVFDNWLEKHHDFPSEQNVWHTRLFSRLWTDTGLPDGASDESLADADEIPIDYIFLKSMRQFCFKQAEYGLELHGFARETGGDFDKDNRFTMAKAIAAAMQRASLMLERQALGVYAPEIAQPVANWHLQPHAPSQPPIGGISSQQASIAPESMGEPATLSELVQGWWREAQAAGLKPSTHESYRNTFALFVAFLGHDDATRVTKNDVIGFKDHRLTTPSRRTGKVPSTNTVKDSDLSALKVVFGWAVANLKVPENPAIGVTVRAAKPVKIRSKGFSDAEAKAILKASLNHQSTSENPKTAAAKRWAPWLCAFTGARVGEIAQLRKEDVRQEGDYWVIRITPEAGTVKTNQAREIVLHQQLIDLGFPAFVGRSAKGALFLTPDKNGAVLGPLQGVKNRLAEFARTIVSDPNVAPNHGWRHRFKTIGMEAGIAPRILDAIQGQAARTVADTYGDVTLKTISAAIDSLPAYDLELD